MKERPILMSAPMVRAILAGTKTQTRRVMKPQPSPELLQDYANIRAKSGTTRTDAEMLAGCLPCPYGEVGGKLWVRETHIDLGACCLYRADAGAEQERAIAAPNQRWRPSIHMPRWASRITLEITDVRVERLQEISEADAIAEGIGRYDNGTFGLNDPGACMGTTAVVAYMRLWESINGAGSWDANPWVWAITFRRLP